MPWPGADEVASAAQTGAWPAFQFLVDDRQMLDQKFFGLLSIGKRSVLDPFGQADNLKFSMAYPIDHVGIMGGQSCAQV
ncbi:MAG: hypothetical protein MUD11_13440, partial [Rhodobacteraceae bacterium]|nr:hypothetical protein [Paracoccaceae bacterium]